MAKQEWVCNDCRYAENGWPDSLLKCELLERKVVAGDPCAVNTEALRRLVKSNEHLDDEIRDLREALDELAQARQSGHYWLWGEVSIARRWRTSGVRSNIWSYRSSLGERHSSTSSPSRALNEVNIRGAVGCPSIPRLSTVTSTSCLFVLSRVKVQ